MPLKKGADPYKILDLTEKRSAKDIREAYKAQCIKWSPERNSNNQEEAAKKLEEVRDAFEFLSNKEQRAAYDKKVADVKRGITRQLETQLQKAMIGNVLSEESKRSST